MRILSGGILAVLMIIISTSIAGAQSIEYVGSIYMPYDALDISVMSEIALIAGGRFAIADISDPTSPEIISDLEIFGISVAIQDHYAFLASTQGMQIVDISDPYNPSFVSQVYHPYAKDVYVLGNLAFVTGELFNFSIFDISDIENPTRLSLWQTTLYPDCPGYVFHSAIRVEPPFAYVGFHDPEGCYGGLRIFDISDPSDPVVVGAIGVDCNDISILGDLMFVAGPGFLRIYDLADPINPDMLGHYEFQGYGWALSVDENFACLTNRDNGVEVVSIADPHNPTWIASYDTPGRAWGIDIIGDLIYIADEDSLQILRLTQTEISEDAVQPPASFSLAQNYPNPFNAQTAIRYDLPVSSDVRIEVYDILGRKIQTLVSENQEAGAHKAVWDASNIPSGIYFYRIQAGDYAESKSCVLLK